MSAGSLEHRVTGVYGGFSQVSTIECVVLKAYFPDDDKNVSKQYMEYDVFIVKSKTTLRNVRHLLSMGGYTDGDYSPLRECSGQVDNEKDPTWSVLTNSAKLNGDRVLVGFIQGSQEQPVIVGVLPHPATKYGGKRSDGRKRFGTHQGTSWVVDKDGNLEVSLKADDKLTVKSKNTTFTVDDKAKKTTINIANGAAEVVIDGEAKKVTIKSQGASVCELGAATDAMMLGTTYRNGEQTMDNQVVGQLGTLSGLVTTAGAQLTAAATPLAIPIVGGALAAPFIAAAGAALTSAVSALQQILAAINTFEGAAQTYLSKKNKLD